MPYDSPSGVNMTEGFSEAGEYLGEVTSAGLFNFWSGLLLTIYIIIIIGYYKATQDFPAAIAVSGFAVFVISLLFWMGNLIHGGVFAIAIALAVVGVAVLLTQDRPAY